MRSGPSRLNAITICASSPADPVTISRASIRDFSIAAALPIAFLLPFIVTVAGLIEPLKSPLQPLNCQPAAGLAVKVTPVPSLKEAPEGVAEPGGLSVTLPEPVVFTVNVRWVSEGLISTATMAQSTTPLNEPLTATAPAEATFLSSTATELVKVLASCRTSPRSV